MAGSSARAIGGGIAGFVVFNMTLMLMEGAASSQTPMPAGLDMADEGAMRAWVATLPASVFVLVMVGWALGSLLGGLTARLIARRSEPAIVVGVLGTIAAIMNNLSVPGPTWMWAGLLLFLPFAMAGDRIGGAPYSAPGRKRWWRGHPTEAAASEPSRPSSVDRPLA